MSAATKCEFCDKRGLPLVLVRDAIAPSKSGAPETPSLPIKLASSAAHYTKRLLRSGYVNVFDEARKRWETYFVTSDNYFFKLVETPGVMPIIPVKPFNCADESHRALASCITVSDPLNASKVWIGFSDVLWTAAIRRANEDISFRRRHMAEVDVKAALRGSSAHHISIAQLSGVIAEYAMVPSQAKGNFAWSPFDFDSRYGRADVLKKQCESLRLGSGLIVTLPDPAGIAQELAFLMRRNADLFIDNNPENKKNIAASSAIDQIRAAVCQQAENTEIAAADFLVSQQMDGDRVAYSLSEAVREKTDGLDKITMQGLIRETDGAWDKYAAKFDDLARQQWYSPFKERLKVYDETFIAPLAKSHVAWMRSENLIAYFECNYDTLHAESGVVYTSIVTQCIAATQDKIVCSDLYNEWLGGEISDTKNLLLRAMILNQKITADAIKKVEEGELDLRQMPWDSIFAASGLAMKGLSEQAQNVTAGLIVQVAGGLAGVFNRIMDGSTRFRAAVMATGIISGHPVAICTVNGTKKEFVALLTKNLIELSGQSVNKAALKKAVRIELRRQQIYGVPLEGTSTKRWIMNVDKAKLAGMPAILTAEGKRDWIARSVKTPEAIESLNLNRWRTVITTDVRAGIVGGILQAVCLTKLIQDEKNSLSQNKADASRRCYAAIASIAMTTSEVIGNALEGRVAIGMKFGQGLALRASGFLAKWGARGGVAAGLVMAYLDIDQAFAEYREGAAGLVVVSYFASAVVGGSLSLAIFWAGSLGAAAIPVIGILLLLAIGIGILIENIKDNSIQDWLERCPWGKLKAQRYPDFATQQAQLKMALSEG
jgi:hypothetical protein